jgi:hypothetical protein
LETEIQKFSTGEVEMGVRYIYNKSHFTLDKRFLCQSAELVLTKLKQGLKFTDAQKEVLLAVRNFDERRAYADAIGKMLSERSVLHRRKVPA